MSFLAETLKIRSYSYESALLPLSIYIELPECCFIIALWRELMSAQYVKAFFFNFSFDLFDYMKESTFYLIERIMRHEMMESTVTLSPRSDRVPESFFLSLWSAGQQAIFSFLSFGETVAAIGIILTSM